LLPLAARPIILLVKDEIDGRRPVELFAKLFGTWLLFAYHCFDRIVLSGYLMGLQRPGQVVYWLQQVLGVEAITKEVLSRRTQHYIAWVESYARNQKIALQWAEKDTRKEDYVLPYLRRMERDDCYGVYFIFQAMEQGWTFRPGYKLVSRIPGGPADYPILHKHRARYRYFYFYLRDEALGPMIMRIGTFIPFEASYYLNGHSYIEQELRQQGIGFRKEDNAFLAVEDVSALQAAADRLSGDIIQKRLNYWTFVLGPKFTKRDRRAALLERSYYVHQVEYCQNFIFKRNHPIRKIFERSCELALWRMTGERIWRAFGRGHRDRIKGKLQTIMERIEHGQHVFRAYWKHAWVKQYEKYSTYLRNEVTSNNLRDFNLHKGLAYLGYVRTRLLEVLLHTGTAIGGWSTKQIHAAILDRFRLSAHSYMINSLRYDLRKLKGHGLLERESGRYAYRLTPKGQRVAILFLLFHQRLCGPVVGSHFQHRPQQRHYPKGSQLERAYYNADRAIDEIVSLLRAA